MVNCISCKKDSEEGIKFKCPKCKKEVFRCPKCRSLAIEYKCDCGFEGP